MPAFIKRCYRWHFCFPIAVLVAVGLAPASSFAAPCNPAPISNRLPYHSDPRAPGVTTDRFLVPPGDRPVVHGVDVSKYQDLVDFEAVKSCGGSFAFIRLSAGVNVGNELLYRDLWNNARSVGLLTGGYHNFTLDLPSGSVSGLPSSEYKVLVEKNEQRAAAQATLYLARLVELRDLEIVSGTRKRAFTFLPPMLDLSARPSGQLAGDKRFADLHRSAVCKWIEDVTGTKEFSIQKVILFLSTSTYRDMAIGSLPCISSVAGLWIEERTKNGGIPDYIETPKDGSPCGDKVPCLFQQYTAHGKFAVFGKDRSIDLDRFFGSEDNLRKLLITVE